MNDKEVIKFKNNKGEFKAIIFKSIVYFIISILTIILILELNGIKIK
jgi:hypothetical protein